MTREKNNPIFIRRPTPQQVTAYREAGIFRRLLEKYPEWGVEQGYLEKEDTGWFSRVFGGAKKQDTVEFFDEEAARERIRRQGRLDREALRSTIDRRRDAELQRQRLEELAVQKTRTTRPVTPRVSRGASRQRVSQAEGITRLTVVPRPEATEATSKKDSAVQIADAFAGQDIAEAASAVKEAAESTGVVQDVEDSKQVLSEPVNASAAKEAVKKSRASTKRQSAAASSGDSGKKSPPANQAASDKKAQEPATFPALDKLKAALRKPIPGAETGRGGKPKAPLAGNFWLLVSILTENGGQDPIAIITKLKGSLGSDRYVGVINGLMALRDIDYSVSSVDEVGSDNNFALFSLSENDGNRVIKVLMTSYQFLEAMGSVPGKGDKVLAEMTKLVESDPKKYIVKSASIVGALPKQDKKAKAEAKAAKKAAKKTAKKTAPQTVSEKAEAVLERGESPQIDLFEDATIEQAVQSSGQDAVPADGDDAVEDTGPTVSDLRTAAEEGTAPDADFQGVPTLRGRGRPSANPRRRGRIRKRR